MLNICLSHFLFVYNYQSSDYDKHYNLVSVSIVVGNKMLNPCFMQVPLFLLMSIVSTFYSTVTDILGYIIGGGQG